MRTLIGLLLAVRACVASCASPTPWPNCSHLSTASVFFVGEVVSSVPTGRRTFFGGGYRDYDIFVTRYRVTRGYVGAPTGTEVAVENISQPAIGATHFVEAYRRESSISTNYGPCGLLPDPSGETLQQFLERRAGKPKLPASLSISVLGPLDPPPAYSITLRGPGRRRSMTSPGRASVPNLRPGHYRVTVAAVPGYQPATLELDLLPAACLWTMIQLSGAGKVSGQVVNQDQTPLPGAHVELQRTEPDRSGGLPPTLNARADHEGRYVIDAVPPGVYRVLVHGKGVRPAGMYAVRSCRSSPGDQELGALRLISISPAQTAAKLDITLEPDRVFPKFGPPRGAACGDFDAH